MGDRHMTSSGCLDLEAIAAYLDGRVTDHERAEISRHLSACDECYELFAESSREMSPRSNPAWLRYVLPLAGLAAAAAIVLTMQPMFQRRVSDRGDLRAALVAAVGARRATEARLTGGFAYAAMPAAFRTGEPVSDSRPPDVRIAVARIEKQTADRRSPEALASLGVAYLVMGETDRAVPVLEEAADRPNPPANVLSDLAAAYLARATSQQHPEDLAKALTFAERAVKADPKLAEASFNRALALDRLSLKDQARKAWEDYLKSDDQSGWAAEARSHLAALNQSGRSSDAGRRRFEAAALGDDTAAVLAAVKESPSAARDWIEDQLLTALPDAVAANRAADARAVVRRTMRVAAALHENTGDLFHRDMVTAVVNASTREDSFEALAAAHRLYRAAQDKYDVDVAESARLMREAVEALRSVRSPLEIAAGRYLAIASFYSSDFDGALAKASAVADEARERQYFRLAAASLRLTGLIHVVKGDLAAGLDAYRAALGYFARVGDAENEAAIHAAIAENLDFIGESRAAWLERYAGLARIDEIRNPLPRHNILLEASQAALRQDLPETALHIQEALLDNARRWGRAPALIDGYLNRAEIHTALARRDRAAEDLDDARAALADVRDAKLASENEARILLAHGESIAASQPNAAVAELSNALVHFERTGTTWRLARVYLARGRAERAAHRDDLAERDFESGIRVFEKMRDLLTTEALRSSYFEQPWDLFSEMIRLQVAHHRPDAALRYAEQARSRTLLEALAGAKAHPADPSSIRSIVPGDATVVYYSTLEDRLLIWVLSRSTEEFVESAVRQADLARFVRDYRSATTEGWSGRTAPALAALYDGLVRPIESRLAGRRRLIIVPDGILHAVPFAALIRREDHRYLVERFTLEVTPSLTIFESQNHPAARRPAAATALIVGNPEASGVVDLPGAEAEAREVAAVYGNADLLVGKEATKARFLDAAGAHAVVHFAGHAVANEDYPALSRLLLSGDSEDARSLFAHEISHGHFDRTQLVVLAACRTNAGRIRRAEGVFNLARPFIAAGVPTVVASLWDVDDRASRSLFLAFHRALRRGEPPADALRAAQLAALSAPDHTLRDPSAWGSFVVVGGRAALN